MVLYFTGTGNSKYVAEKVAKGTSEKLVCLNDLIKNGKAFTIDEDVILVAPIYAWRMPRFIGEWLQTAKVNNGTKIWFVFTCGGEIANASKYAKELCEQIGLLYMGAYEVVMPDNYIIMFTINSPNEAKNKIDKANVAINSIIEYVNSGKRFSDNKNSLYYKLLSGPVNNMFYKFYVKADGFYTESSCVGCGKCVEKCPFNNIILQGGRPIWGSTCTSCMACISYCPTGSIEYGKKTKGKDRYIIENLNLDKE